MSDERSPGPDLDRPVSFITDPRLRMWLLAARALVVVAVILGAWVVLALVVNSVVDEGMYPGDTVFLLGYAVAALLVTVVLGWSLRSDRLRRALAPLEVGVFVGAVAYVSSLLFPNLDSYGGQGNSAPILGILAVMVWVVVAGLVRGRPRERAWLIGTLGAMVLVAFLYPPINGMLDGAAADAFGGEFSADAALAGRFAQDGSYSITSSGAVTSSTIDAGYEPHATSADQFGVSGVSGPSYAPAYAVAGTPAPASTLATGTGQVEPFGDVDLRVVSDGSLRLDVQPSGADTESVLEAVVVRGTCREPRARVGTTISLPVGSRSRVALDLSLDDLATDRELAVVAGSGEALAPVRCVDLVDRAALAAAQLGAAEFGARCIKPLHVGDVALRGMTAASFQDPDCADEWSQLSRVAAAQYVTDPVADAIRRCLREFDLDETNVKQLPGEESLLDTGGTVSDPRTYDCISIRDASVSYSRG